MSSAPSTPSRQGPGVCASPDEERGHGTIKVNRIRSSDKVEDVSIDKRQMEFLYPSGPNGPWVFMDQESYEQVELDEDLVGDSAKFLKENTVCEVQVFDEKPLGIELLQPSIWKSQATPQPKGDGDQPVEGGRCRDGSTCRVPSFIEQGTVVRINAENQGVSRQGLRCSRCEIRELLAARGLTPRPSVRAGLLARSRQDR